MTIFDREFQIERLSDGVLKENGWLRDQLHLWHPSGDAIGRHTDQGSKEHQNAAFNQNGHLKKLRDEPCSLQVQMVKGLHDWTLDVHL
jgi:hypothetical protein